YVWGERGVWAVRLNPVAWYDSQVRFRSNYNNTELAYQWFGSPVTSTLTLPGPRWVVADLGSDGEHVLLADLTATDGPNPVSRLYVANGDGTGRHLLYSYDGGFEAAQLSPDSAHALVTTYSSVPGVQRERHTAVLLDAKSNTPPRVLA